MGPIMDYWVQGATAVLNGLITVTRPAVTPVLVTEFANLSTTRGAGYSRGRVPVVSCKNSEPNKVRLDWLTGDSLLMGRLSLMSF